MTSHTEAAGTPPSLATELDALGVSDDRWIIDPVASTFELRGRYVFGPAVTARFAIDSGRVDIRSDRSGINGTLLLDATSLDSGIGIRDQHLRERRRALDVDRFPTIRFELDRAAPGRQSTFEIRGRVTLRDLTRPVELSVDARLDGEGAELVVTGDLEHRPFKVGMPALGRHLAVHARLRAVVDRTPTTPAATP